MPAANRLDSPAMRKIPQIIGLLAPAIVLLSSCTKDASSPPFGEPQASSPSESAPAVDEALAREAGQQQIIYHMGPVDLPAHTSADAMIEKPLLMRFQTDKEIWATGFIPRVVDANGALLPRELLHQAIVFNMHEENPLCAGSPNPFFIATSMMTEVDLPQGFGYPILASDPLEARVVLANPSDKDYIDVFFELSLVARPMNEFAGLKDVKPMLLEIDPCSHAPMDAPPREFTEKSATYQVPQKAGLVMAHGAIQDYGAAVQLISGKEVMPFWRAEGVLGEDHHITELTGNPFEDSEGVGFKAGDQITFTAAYDNTSDKWLPGATAAAMVYLTPRD